MAALVRTLAAPFSLGAGEDAVLLLHGMTGSPHEMRPLGEFLAERGFRVHCPLLPGHGTDPRDLGGVTAQALYAAAREALGRVADARRTYVAGLSMGALLAVLLARDEVATVQGLALLAPAFRMRSSVAHALVSALSRAPLGPLGRLVIGKRGSDQPRGRPADDPSYDAVALDGARALGVLMGQAWAALPRVTAPTLVLCAELDRTIDPATARAAAARLAGPVRVESLPLSGHVIPLDREAGRALDLCAEHFTQLSRAAGPAHSRASGGGP